MDGLNLAQDDPVFAETQDILSKALADAAMFRKDGPKFKFIGTLSETVRGRSQSLADLVDWQQSLF